MNSLLKKAVTIKVQCEKMSLPAFFRVKRNRGCSIENGKLTSRSNFLIMLKETGAYL